MNTARLALAPRYIRFKDVDQVVSDLGVLGATNIRVVPDQECVEATLGNCSFEFLRDEVLVDITRIPLIFDCYDDFLEAFDVTSISLT